jgi:hypothetical protein
MLLAEVMLKFAPVMVITAPTGPLVGVMVVMVGACPYSSEIIDSIKKQ